MSDRYSRQILFSPIGIEGQDKIRSKHVLIIGAGALGSGNAEMLTRAGVGKLTIVDRDYVEESNLQRQQLYTERDVEQKLPKAAAAEKRLREINSDVQIEAVIGDANPEKLAELAQGKDLIIDSTDNFETTISHQRYFTKVEYPLDLRSMCGKLWHELYDYPRENAMFKLPIKNHSDTRNDLRYGRDHFSCCRDGSGPSNSGGT